MMMRKVRCGGRWAAIADFLRTPSTMSGVSILCVLCYRMGDIAAVQRFAMRHCSVGWDAQGQEVKGVSHDRKDNVTITFSDGQGKDMDYVQARSEDLRERGSVAQRAKETCHRSR